MSGDKLLNLEAREAGTSAMFEWTPELRKPLGLRVYDARHLIGFVPLDETQARELFNWLGVQLHKAP